MSPTTSAMHLKQNDESVTTMECLKTHAHCIAMAGEHLCVGGRNVIKVMDVATGECSRTIEGHTHDVNALVAVDNTLFSGADATGATREYLKSWNVATGELIHTFAGHTAGVWAVAAAPGLLFSGSEDKTVRVWDADTAECKHVLEGHTEKVRSLHYRSEEGVLYSGANDGRVIVWNTSTGEQVRSYDGQGGWITAIAVRGGLVVASSTDKTVNVYDKASGERLSTVTNESWVSSLAIGEDGNTVYAGVGDGSVCAWTAKGAELRFKLSAHLEFHAVSALLLDGDTLLVAGWDGCVARWDMASVHERVASGNTVEDTAEVEVNVTKVSSTAESSSGNIFDDVTDCELLD